MGLVRIWHTFPSSNAFFCIYSAMCEASCTWSGQLPPKNYKNPTYSCKVFLGGVPWDITEGTVTYCILNTFKENCFWVLRKVWVKTKNRVPTVLEKSLNFWFSLKSPWKWICPWKVLEFRGPSLKFQLVVLDFLFCVFWTESLNGYSKLRGTRANVSPKIRLALLTAAYKLNIFPVPLAHI